MKHFIKIIALISALCLVLGAFSGCSSTEETTVEEYNADNYEIVNEESGVIAENENFVLNWTKSSVVNGMEIPRAIITVKSKKDGKVWSTTPKEYFDKAPAVDEWGDSLLSTAGEINSPLTFDALLGQQVLSYDAYNGSIMNGRFSSEKIENGISVTFYFDEIGVIITVDYYLEDGAFKVKVDPQKIKALSVDGAVQKIVSVSPAPFMCSTQNKVSGSTDSYMVIPSGQGALMYNDQRSDGVAREFKGEVYGEDLNFEEYDDADNDTPITMPFYGIKDGNSALCAIIEQGAETCSVSARSGDALLAPVAKAGAKGEYGFSNVWASYNTIANHTVYGQSQFYHIYNDRSEPNINPMVVGYYPLANDQANYTGIAKRYQQYLVEKEGLKKSQDNSLLTVKLYGAYVEDELFVGIPYKKNVALTTFEEATTIIDELKGISGGSIIADMYAYGEDGLAANQLAGGYTFDDVCGGEDQLEAFLDYTNKNSVKTFFNFDIINMYESGGGYSISDDTALNLNGAPAAVYSFKRNTRIRNKIADGGRVGALISREKIDDAALDAVELADEYGITGIAFDTLGNSCYSDYIELEDQEKIYKYSKCNNMGNDVKKVISSVKENSKTVMIDGAFAYAAVNADIITGAPTITYNSNSFDLDVPLYQIVFQGYKANSVAPINTANNSRKQFLKAVETGSGLSFDLMANYYRDVRKESTVGLQAMLYEDNKAKIEAYVSESKDYLTSVAGASILSHSVVAKDVAKTVFDNGVTVYVNYSDKDYKSDIGTVKAMGFLSKEWN